MRDSPPGPTTLKSQQGSVIAAQTDHEVPAANDPTESTEAHDLRVIHAVVSRYVRQLLHGCNDPDCTEKLCDTGRRNTSQQPVRKYTPRSARAIAMALASGPNPRSHLCKHYSSKSGDVRGDFLETPKDPSSFVQQLSDSTSMRKLARRPKEVLKAANHTEVCNTWHAALEDISRSLFSDTNSTIEEILMSNEQISYRLFCCVRSLLDQLPAGNTQQWRHVNNIVSAGCSYPPHLQDDPCDPVYNTWLDILDALEHPPSFRLLCHVLAVLRGRRAVELKAVKNPLYLDGESRSIFSRLADHLLTGVASLLERLNLIVWLKKVFLFHWGGEVIFRDVTLAQVSLELITSIVERATELGLSAELFEELLPLPIVACRLDAVELARTWMSGPRSSHLLNFGFLYSIHQEATYFRAMCHLSMRKTNSDAEIASALRSRARSQSLETTLEGRLKHLEERYLLLHVSRESVLQDAFDQLWQRRKSDLLRPLRVRLGEMDGLEVGHDLGGVQIEFFNLVCRALLDESAQMFTTDPATGLGYFCPGSLQPLYMFELCGLLFAIAIYNGISLPINLPLAFYLILVGKHVTLASIADGWPVIKRSLDRILSEDVPGLEAAFPLEANGLRLTVLPTTPGVNGFTETPLHVVDATIIAHHDDLRTARVAISEEGSIGLTDDPGAVDIGGIANAWPGWYLLEAAREPGEVTSEEKSAYVNDYVDWLTWGCVNPQWKAFRKGFECVLDDLSMISFQNLPRIVEGTQHFDIHELRRVTTYEGYESMSKYIQNFWRLVIGWPEEKQRQLLKFVTACERIPPGGATSLTFKIQRSNPGSVDHLPTSSTCFGTLMLPKYSSVDMLDKKLSLALKYGVEGFGSG